MRDQLIQTGAADARDSDDGRSCEECAADLLLDLEHCELAPVVIAEVGFGEGDHAVAESDVLENAEMLLGLRHPTFSYVDSQDARMDSSDAGQHVRDEADVPGNVDECDAFAIGQCHVRETEVDRETAPSLFLPSIRVDTGEGADESRLSMIDMSGRGEDPHDVRSSRIRNPKLQCLGERPG